MIENMDLDEPIPPEWRVRGADSHLHSIGLSLFKPQLHPNRRLLYHPLLIFTVMFTNLCKCLGLTYCDVNGIKLSRMSHILLGDVDYPFKLGHLTNILMIYLCTFNIGSQLINYYNYRNGIKPTDLRIFHMISGLISPKSIGIHDQILVHRLCNITRKVLNLSRFFTYIALTIGIFYVGGTYFLWDDLTCIILVGIPHFIYHVCFEYHVINIQLYQGVYYFLITYYLKKKINLLNVEIYKRLCKPRNTNYYYNHWFTMKTIRELNAIYVEINEYNSQYWSKYLTLIWFTQCFTICYTSYLLIFSNLLIAIKITTLYVTFIYTMVLLFIIHTSSQLYNETNNSYIVLNSYITHTKLISIKSKLKVCLSLSPLSLSLSLTH